MKQLCKGNLLEAKTKFRAVDELVAIAHQRFPPFFISFHFRLLDGCITKHVYNLLEAKTKFRAVDQLVAIAHQRFPPPLLDGCIRTGCIFP